MGETTTQSGANNNKNILKYVRIPKQTVELYEVDKILGINLISI